MPELISNEDRKARKTHTCDYCGDVIEVGEVYNHAVLKSGEIYTWDIHKKCEFVSNALWDFVDPYDGMTKDDFNDACISFCNTFICPDCEHWDRDAEGCNKDEIYCVDKIYDFLQTHDFKRVDFATWKCFPKEGVAKGES